MDFIATSLKERGCGEALAVEITRARSSMIPENAAATLRPAQDMG